ncbi:MAG: hypothetical protein JO337_03795 [Acidimicrobiales bacterium]|nr:hypothetical protein [Acidimicrobiales bacterium]
MPVHWGRGVALVAFTVIMAAGGCAGASHGPRGRVGLPTGPAQPNPTNAPTSTSSSTSTTVPKSLPVPAPIAPVATPALPGEGVWQPAPGSAETGGYAIYTTQLRPAPGFPPSAVAWIDSTAARVSLYAGSGEPSGTWPHQGYVATADQANLLAAFNGGFKIYSYNTGWYDDGRAAVALQPGYASFVVYTDGTATVGAWGLDVALSADVQSVRQNLQLLVDKGAPAATADAVGAWGATLGGVTNTWRSGVGVTADDDLVYVGGPYLSPALLARVLVAAGAIKAMELDINPQWVSFATYVHPAPDLTTGSNILSGMFYSPSHYLQPDARDFFAVFSRPPGA